MARHIWSALSKQQVGAYFEYFVKMELTMHGFEVYTPEIDDHGVDLVARRGRTGQFIDMQVKALRGHGYVFLRKRHFEPSERLYLALGLLVDGSEPQMFLVPSMVWRTPDSVFASRDYDKPEQKSEPEWGINVSKGNVAALDRYRFDSVVAELAR